MRFLLLLSIVLGIVTISTAWRFLLRGRSKYAYSRELNLSSEKDLPKEQWFMQYLDHFNPADHRTWKQKYFVNIEFYKVGGPVFLLIGGEGAADAEMMVNAQWVEYAKEFQAMCFYVEHRFYGKSHPTADLSVKNLMYLHSDLALADLAYFIQSNNIDYKLPNDTKWIVFGGSYAGSLSAWMRVKYPHLVHGAVSTSGPLLAKIDFQEYFSVVADVLKKSSQKCLDTLAEANKQVHILLHHVAGQQRIQKLFKLCDPIDPGHTKKTDILNLYETLAGNVAGIVQYNKDNRPRSPTRNITVDDVCNILVDETIRLPVERLALVNNMILNATKEKCLDYRYGKMIRELRNITWTSEQAEGGRQWVYQTCTEFGFFQTSTAQPTLFPNNSFPVDFFVQQCVDIFGPRYNLDLLKLAVSQTNILYGALNIQATNVVFVHGSDDPWHVLGVTHSSNPQAPAILINGTAHCADMYAPTEQDMPQLKDAKMQIRDLIEQWLKN